MPPRCYPLVCFTQQKNGQIFSSTFSKESLREQEKNTPKKKDRHNTEHQNPRMLRRAFIPTTSSSVVAGGLFSSSAVAASRSVIAFSADSEALANVAKHNDYSSKIWVDEFESYWYRDKTKLKPDQTPTTARIPVPVSYFNMSQFVRPPAPEKKPANERTHTDFMTGTNLGMSERVRRLLTNTRRNHKYESHMWITESAARKLNLLRRRLETPMNVRFMRECKVYNADQFEDPSVFRTKPINPLKRKVLRGHFDEALQKHAAANNFPTAVYLSKQQLKVLGFGDEQIPADVEPVELEYEVSHRGFNGFYNLEQLENHEKLTEELGRPPVSQHTFLANGNAVRETSPYLAEFDKIVETRGFKSKYWADVAECKQKNWKPIKGEQPLLKLQDQKKLAEAEQKRQADGPHKFYNLNQLTDPEAVLAKIARFDTRDERRGRSNNKNSNNDNNEMRRGNNNRNDSGEERPREGRADRARRQYYGRSNNINDGDQQQQDGQRRNFRRRFNSNRDGGGQRRRRYDNNDRDDSRRGNNNNDNNNGDEGSQENFRRRRAEW